MGTETTGVLMQALFAGATNFDDPALAEAFLDEGELADVNMALGALLADLEQRGEESKVVSSLREKAHWLARLVGGYVVGSRERELRKILEAIAGKLGRIPQVRLETSLKKVRRHMRFGSAEAVGGQAREFLRPRGEGGIDRISGLKNADEALRVIMTNPKTTGLLQTLQPDGGQRGDRRVMFQLDNGVVVKIEAQTFYGNTASRPGRLHVEIDSNMGLFVELRKKIFARLGMAYGIAALLDKAGWILGPQEFQGGSIVMKGQGENAHLTMGIGGFISWLDISLVDSQSENYKDWLSSFLQAHLEGGVFGFQPVASPSGGVTETD